MKKLQEVLVKQLSENEPSKENISNQECVSLFLDAKQIEGCSARTVQYYKVTLDAPHDRLKISGVEIRLRALGRQLGIERIHPHKLKSVIQEQLKETQLLFDSLMQQYFG